MINIICGHLWFHSLAKRHAFRGHLKDIFKASKLSLLSIKCYRTAYCHDRDALTKRALSHSERSLAGQRLTIYSSLSSYYQVCSFENFIEMDCIQHHLHSPFKASTKELTESKTKSPGSA